MFVEIRAITAGRCVGARLSARRERNENVRVASVNFLASVSLPLRFPSCGHAQSRAFVSGTRSNV